jgi:mono/diheme cytochrome c family protein
MNRFRALFLVLCLCVPCGSLFAAGNTGRELFENYCAACHGRDGTAPNGLAANLHRPLKHGNGVKAIANTIRAGVPGTQMPPFSGLAQGDIEKLAEYVRSLNAVARK